MALVMLLLHMIGSFSLVLLYQESTSGSFCVYQLAGYYKGGDNAHKRHHHITDKAIEQWQSIYLCPLPKPVD